MSLCERLHLSSPGLALVFGRRLSFIVIVVFVILVCVILVFLIVVTRISIGNQPQKEPTRQHEDRSTGQSTFLEVDTGEAENRRHGKQTDLPFQPSVVTPTTVRYERHGLSRSTCPGSGVHRPGTRRSSGPPH